MSQGTASLSRYFHTIRYLKLSQIFWRLWYRYRTARLSAVRRCRRSSSGRWCSPVASRGCMSSPVQFTFLNREEHVDFPSGCNDDQNCCDNGLDCVAP